MLKSFGLIYKDKFEQISLSATDVSFMINFNSAFGMAFGMIAAPFINKFGYRKVAVIGGAVFSIGVASASFSHNFWSFFISFGIVQGNVCYYSPHRKDSINSKIFSSILLNSPWIWFM